MSTKFSGILEKRDSRRLLHDTEAQVTEAQVTEAHVTEALVTEAHIKEAHVTEVHVTLAQAQNSRENLISSTLL